MLRNMKLRKSFTLIMLGVYIISLPIMVFITYRVLLKNAENESLERARLVLSSLESVKSYVGGVMRPVVEDLIPGKEPVELTSGFFIIREISDTISESIKDFSFKFATLNPLNPVNKANQFEAEKINEFRMKKIIDEWKGLVKTPNGHLYVIMVPIVVEAGCAQCHGNPQVASEEQRERYGAESGYNWKEGEIIGATTVYVPAEVPITNAKKALVIFSIVYSIFFLFIIIVIDRLIKANVIKPIENLVTIADEISRGNLDKEFEIKGKNEIASLAEAFTRMKLSLAKAIDIMKRK